MKVDQAEELYTRAEKEELQNLGANAQEEAKKKVEMAKKAAEVVEPSFPSPGLPPAS